ncbi:MAG: CPXCG motif-containing cysteine-rich protein [Pirellulales bacterium]
MKILFLHGWKSVVGGVKPSYLAIRGHEVCNPKLDDDDFALALSTAQASFDAFEPDIVVGSSRGGALAMNLDHGSIPLVLLCPAWKRWGKVHGLPPRALILHSRDDDVIPFEDSLELVQNSRSSEDVLVETGSDHRLADPSSLEVMEWACRFLTSSDYRNLNEEASPDMQAVQGVAEECDYCCGSCGERIVIPIDTSQGNIQVYVEDCPVCCHPNILHLTIDDSGWPHIDSQLEHEQDP